MQITLFDREQIKKIHAASLEILHRTGCIIPHPELLSRFADRGAAVDTAGSRVRIPPDLVMNCIGEAGKEFTLYGRDLERTAVFGKGKRNYNSVAGEAFWVDNPGEPRRYALMKDVGTAAMLADGLEHINIVGAMADPSEIPIERRCIEVFFELIQHTGKPVTFWFHDRASAKVIVELITVLRGDIDRASRYPICFPLLEPISPLRFPFHGLDLLFETARISMPVPVGPMAQMGVSAPCTIASTLALQNAEILAGICAAQLISPGMRVCYGGICHAFDMRSTQMIFAGPEQAIFSVAMTEMGKYYGLPVYINAGLTDSKVPDAQAGLESGMTLAAGAAAGADIFGHMGISGVDQAGSPDMLVLQDEIIGYVESMLRPVEVNDATLQLDLIDEIGPGGSFIDTMHTAENFRDALWFPGLLDREYFQAWLDDGGKDMRERCRIRKRDILKQHKPIPLPEDLKTALQGIINGSN